MPSDVQMCSKVRKIVIACWLDISRVRIRVTRGVIHLQGPVSRMGEDPNAPEGNLPFLERLDQQLRALPGLKGVHYTFDNWQRENTGIWRYSGKRRGRGK